MVLHQVTALFASSTGRRQRPPSSAASRARWVRGRGGQLAKDGRGRAPAGDRVGDLVEQRPSIGLDERLAGMTQRHDLHVDPARDQAKITASGRGRDSPRSCPHPPAPGPRTTTRTPACPATGQCLQLRLEDLGLDGVDLLPRLAAGENAAPDPVVHQDHRGAHRAPRPVTTTLRVSMMMATSRRSDMCFT